MTLFDQAPATADVLVGAAMATSLLLGCLGIRLAAYRGWARRAVCIAYGVLMLYSIELVAVAALLFPGDGFWTALGAAGLVGAAALALSGPALWRRYDEAESRWLMAQDCL
jgi:hypothetical protein